MTTPSPTVWLVLRANDAPALIRFLVAAFGFEETAVFSDGDVVQHAQLNWPLGGGVMLSSARRDPEGIWALPPGAAGAYVVCDDPDKLHARAIAAGARELQPPHDVHGGHREFSVQDPEGNRWSFGSYPGEPRPAA